MCRVYPFQSSVTGVAVATGSVFCACAAGAKGEGLVIVDVCAIAADRAVQISTTRSMFFIALCRHRPLEHRSLRNFSHQGCSNTSLLESQATNLRGHPVNNVGVIEAGQFPSIEQKC